ncbi:hypothetical protein BZG36_01371 [Bifiguratus adelaidae]|uniref:AAA+ ATPase domain-containing protein n=1 Tax=Bifiguratus adelaidae TaxID=1938954 RepID=A0A261Y3D4_9FUNG|nr:hypothetical protein BZG36_01371 [Bifiguratus adelaidae]
MARVPLVPWGAAEWIERVTQRVGGHDDIVASIIGDILQLSRLVEENSAPLHSVPLPRGCCISGIPGTGKTALAQAIADTSGLHSVFVNCPDIFESEEGHSERRLQKLFKACDSHPMSIIVLDEIDVIASKSAAAGGELEAKVYSTLIELIDSLNAVDSTSFAMVIALTSRKASIDAKLLRSGRLDAHYELRIKSPEQRYQVLTIVAKDLPFPPKEREDILQKVARNAHGFVATDLQNVCREAAMQLVIRSERGEQTPLVTMSDMQAILSRSKPSNFTEFQMKIPDITFNDLFGITGVIKQLEASVLMAFNQRKKLEDLGIAPSKGVLIYGPSGVGKTALCSALANAAKVNVMRVECGQLRSKVVGESEVKIARMFEQARLSAPCILFIDQIDILLPQRGTVQTSENSSDRIVTGFLTEMDGFFTKSRSDILLVGVTNRPNLLDNAILRPGRFDDHVYVPPPNDTIRTAIFQGLCRKMPIDITPEQLAYLVRETCDCSGADLESLCREAALLALRQDMHSTRAIDAAF